MTPDALEQIRSNQAVNREAARDNWDRAMVDSIDALLAHIDQQAAQLVSRDTEIDRDRNIIEFLEKELKKTSEQRYLDLQAICDDQDKQIAALKEIAIEAKAEGLLCISEDLRRSWIEGPEEDYKIDTGFGPRDVRGKKSWRSIARQQLEAEHEVMR